MKGIAKNGAGEYFFIDSAEAIPKVVSKAIHGLMDITAANATLRFRGSGGVVVTKVYGFETADLLQPLLVGDLLSDNVRKILVEVEVSCSGPTQPSVTYELNYQPDATKDGICTVKGEIKLISTSDENLIQRSNDEVVVALKIKEAGQADISVANLIGKNKIPEAVSIKREMLKELQSIEHLDATGTVTKLITKGEEALKQLESNQDRKAAAKNFHNLGYMQEEDDDHGYTSAADSDEGCYSDDDDQDKSGSGPDSDNDSD